MKASSSLWAVAFLLLFGWAAQAQEARTALVIGCDYTGTSMHLPSPLADARSLAATLEQQLGFQVAIVNNPSRKQFLEAVNQFGETLTRRNGVGLFFFSGHGAQNDGTNYLLPMNAEIGYQEDLPTEAIAAERIVTRMEAAGNRVNLLFLDACRNNPFPSSRQKSAMAKGLAGMNAANGMLIGFATARNTVANDSGAGSLYTNALLRHILTPGLSVTDMLTRVNSEVRRVSGGSQVPFMEVGLSDVFAFVPSGTVVPPALPPLPAPTPAPVARLAPAPTPIPALPASASPLPFPDLCDGITIISIDAAARKKFQLPQNSQGVVVAQVEPNSVAAKSGLRRGDLLLELDRHPVSRASEAIDLSEQVKHQEEVMLRISSHGIERELLLAKTAATKSSTGAGPKHADLCDGITVINVDPQVSRKYGLTPGAKGALIAQVEPNCAAARAGVKRGDLLLELEHRPITQAVEAIELSEQFKAQDRLLLRISTKGVSREVVLE